MKCNELTGMLERLAPLTCACEWDNVGLLAGRGDKEIRKVFIALDATDEAVEEAIDWGADLLLTHHPLIFKPLKRVNDQDFVGRRLLKLIQKDICYYAMHTNFDAAPGCMADAAAERLGLTDQRVLEQEGVICLENSQKEVCYGIGKTGYFSREMTVREAAELVKERFGLPFATIYGEEAPGRKVRFAAISPGSGGSMIGAALEAGVQVLVTGDIGHHSGIDAAANGLAIIDAGHYGLEHLFLAYMAEYLKEKAGESLEVKTMELKFPQTLV